MADIKHLRMIKSVGVAYSFYDVECLNESRSLRKILIVDVDGSGGIT